MKYLISSVRRGVFGLVAVGVLQACAESEDPSSGDLSTIDADALKDAESVLGFADPNAWTASGDAETRFAQGIDGTGALSLQKRKLTTITSSPFEYRKTPNIVEFSVRAPDESLASLQRARASLACKERDLDSLLLESPTITTSEQDGFYRVRFAVPETVQEAYVGGCSKLVVAVQLTPDVAAGQYEFRAMRLRARTPKLHSLSAPKCTPSDMSELLKSAKETPEGHWDYQSWLAAPVVQGELPGLQSVLDQHTDDVLGVIADHVSKQVVVVVDKDALLSRRVHRALESADIALPLRIQPSCNSVRALRQVQKEFETRSWPDGTPAFAAHPDTATAQYVVTLDPGTEESDEERDATLRQERGESVERSGLYRPTVANWHHARMLENEFGSLVRVKWGRAGRRDRANDSQRHFGGAGIGTNNVNSCTSGFVVNRNGFMGSVTAGHCFKTNGIAITSGIYAYGVSAGIAAFPAYDMTRIDPGLQTYTNTIHTGPSAPLTRVQVGKADPAYLSLVCVSGMVTGAKCGIEVLDNNCAVYNPGMGTTYGLTRGVRDGVLIGQSGDSGAPVYTRSGAVGAIINGMESGGAVEDEICFHKVSTIEYQLGVTVAL